ncbi:MAG: phytanoyl-CoA dioxygenase family protein [Patescibacteria group bacterium]
MKNLVFQIRHYPVDTEGYPIALDPYIDQNSIKDVFEEFGFVVIHKAISTPTLKLAQKEIKKWYNLLKSQKDKDGNPALSRGFLEVYHDSFLHQVRKSKRFIKAHEVIWESSDLWCTFDRVAYKPCSGESSQALKLHVDQNPFTHPNFCCTQGLIAIQNCTLQGGTTRIVGGSQNFFDIFEPFANHERQYVEVDQLPVELISSLNHNWQPVILHDGDGLIWDSRCIHSNLSNQSLKDRIAVLVSYQPASSDQADIQARKTSFETGVGDNNRTARMHASSLPRYTDSEFLQKHRTPEKLSNVSSKLYGLKSYHA